MQLWALLLSAPGTSAQGDMLAHKYTFISPFLCVCFFFLVVQWATSSQRTTFEGQVRLAASPAQTALYVQCRCSALAATDVTWCWAADGASGETVDVWHKVSFKLERARRVSEENPRSTFRRREGWIQTWRDKIALIGRARGKWDIYDFSMNLLHQSNGNKEEQSKHPSFSIYAVCSSAVFAVFWLNICIAVLSRPDSTASAPPPSLFFSSSPFFRLLSLAQPPELLSGCLVAGNAACAGVWGDLSLHGEQEALSSGKSVNEALTICWRLSASCGWISWDFSSWKKDWRQYSAEKQQKFWFQRTPSNSESTRFLSRTDTSGDICCRFCGMFQSLSWIRVTGSKGEVNLGICLFWFSGP